MMLDFNNDKTYAKETVLANVRYAYLILSHCEMTQSLRNSWT